MASVVAARGVGLGEQQQPGVRGDAVDGGVQEGADARGRRCARSQRRRAVQERLLEPPLVLVEQGVDEPGPVAEAAVHRAHADPGGPRDLLQREVPVGDHPGGRFEDLAAVARGVGPLGRRLPQDGKLVH